MKIPKNVLILGCGRSGTSIFGEFFADLTQYQYWSEPIFKEITGLRLNEPFALKFPKSSPGDKVSAGLSFYWPEMKALLGNHRQCYWIVRHPLDTIASLKVGISKNWGHHPQPHDWQKWLTRPLIERCAYHWNYLNTVSYRMVDEECRVVYFEEMLLDTSLFAEEISKDCLIDVERNHEGLQYWCTRVQNSNTAAFIEAKTSTAYSTNDHSKRVGRWKENLTSEEVALAKAIVNDTARNFGYSL